MVWFRPKIRVLFVCSANVCRSPLAEGLLRHRLAAMGVSQLVVVRSAGCRVDQPGRQPDPRISELVASSGVSLAGIRSRKLTWKMIQSSDFVLVMERGHLDDVARLAKASLGSAFAGRRFGDESGLQNVQLLGNFLPLREGRAEDIPDPYFGSRQAIANVHSLLDSALTGFLIFLGDRLANFRRS